MLISSVIYRGERSFNSTSTPSTVELHSCFVHHHLSSTSPPASTTFARVHTASIVAWRPRHGPSPLLRDVSSVNIAPALSQARMLPQPPLPFPKGCGRLILARWRNRRGRMMRGGPIKWEAQPGESWNTNHDVYRGSCFFLSFFEPYWTLLTHSGDNGDRMDGDDASIPSMA